MNNLDDVLNLFTMSNHIFSRLVEYALQFKPQLVPSQNWFIEIFSQHDNPFLHFLILYKRRAIDYIKEVSLEKIILVFCRRLLVAVLHAVKVPIMAGQALGSGGRSVVKERLISETKKKLRISWSLA